MANIAEKYYVRRGEQQFATIPSLFGGVRVLKVEGMMDVGSTKNVYTASWVGSQTEDYMVAGDSVVRENVDINITFIVSNKYGAVNVRQQHDAFIAYMTDGELYIKSDYVGRVMRCVCIKDYKPTSVHIERSGNANDYMIGTLQLHTLDNRAGDDDGYIANPYPSNGDPTPTPTPTQQVNTKNVYDTALGATQASLNQHFKDSNDELADAISLKQDIIRDLETIRTGANKGATAVQPNTLNGYVNGGRYNSQNKRIELLHDSSVIAYINISDLPIGGMIDSVEVIDENLVITFITTTGTKSVSIPITSIFDPNNYYTKSQVDDKINTETLHPITQQEFNEIFN